MTDSEPRRWTEYDRKLYSDHIKKLNAPRPVQTDGCGAISLNESLRAYRALVQGIGTMCTDKRKLTTKLRQELQVLANLQLDSYSGLHHSRHLDAADTAHDGLVLAIKVKNLKELKGREDPPTREFIYRMLVDSLLAQTQHAFAGYFSRMYILVETTFEAWMLVHRLQHDLDQLIEPLILEGIREDELPRIISGFGRTWQEAKLVTRGSLLQDQVPLDDYESSAHSTD